MFDGRTGLFCVGFLYLLLPCATWILPRGRRSTLILAWVVAGLIAGGATFLLASRSYIPDFYSYVVANGLLISAMFIGGWVLLRESAATIDSKLLLLALAVGIAAIALTRFAGHVGLSIVITRLELSIAAYFLAFSALLLGYRESSINAAIIGFVHILVGSSFANQFIVSLNGQVFSPVGADANAVVPIVFGSIAVVVNHVNFFGIYFARNIRKREASSQELAMAHARNFMAKNLSILDSQRSLGIVTAAIAHELRQPQTAVSINATMLERNLENPNLSDATIHEVLNDLHSASLLSIGLMERFKGLVGDHDCDQANVARVVTTVVRLMRGDFELYTVQATINPIADDIWVTADSVQLSQVLLNIVRNAVEAMQTVSTRHLAISATVDDQNACVSIEDSGVGMNAAQLTNFGALYSSSKSGGMGIGIAISRYMLNSFGGVIWAENRSDSGLRVSIKLPLSSLSAVD